MGCICKKYETAVVNKRLKVKLKNKPVKTSVEILLLDEFGDPFDWIEDFFIKGKTITCPTLDPYDEVGVSYDYWEEKTVCERKTDGKDIAVVWLDNLEKGGDIF